MSDTPHLDPQTVAAHAGQPNHAPLQGAPLVPPIVPASVYTYPDLDAVDAGMEHDRRIYRRDGSEAQMLLEEALATLESPRGASADLVTRVTASGQAALAVLLLSVATPERRRVVVVRPCYGGTDALVGGPLARAGLELATVDLPPPGTLLPHPQQLVSAAADERTCAVVCEVITNPLIGLVDVAAVADAAHRAGAACIIDATFATPFLFQPFAHGADAVFHSLSKYLSGHSDVIAGVAMVRATHPAADNIAGTSRLLGAAPGAFDAWLALRGLRTAGLRIERATANARRLAGFLSGHDAIRAVHYPGTRGPVDNDLADDMLPKGRGPMLSVEVRGDEPAVDRLLRAFKLVRLAPSLGDVATTVSHPARTSHRGLDEPTRQRLGITGGLLRISTGIEVPDDLVADFRQALDAAI